MEDDIARTMQKDKLRHEMVEGLLYTYMRLSDTTKKTLDVASFVYGLIELLSEKGLISIEELDARKLEVAQRLMVNANSFHVVTLRHLL